MNLFNLLIIFFSSLSFAIDYRPNTKAAARQLLQEVPGKALNGVFTLLDSDEERLDPNDPEDVKFFIELSRKFYIYGTSRSENLAFFLRHKHFLTKIDDLKRERICRDFEREINTLFDEYTADTISLFHTADSAKICANIPAMIKDIIPIDDLLLVTKKIPEFSSITDAETIRKILIEKMIAAQTSWKDRGAVLQQIANSIHSSYQSLIEYIRNKLFNKFVLPGLKKSLDEDPTELNDLKKYFGKFADISSVRVMEEIVDFIDDKSNDDQKRQTAFESSLSLFLFFDNFLHENETYNKIGIKYFKYAGKTNSQLNKHYDKVKTELAPIIKNSFLENLKEYHEIIFSDVPVEESEKARRYLPQEVRKVFYNNAGYETIATNQDQFCSEHCHQAQVLVLPRGTYIVDNKPVEIENNIPIGYNIHLPKTAVNGIFVDVYGGGIEASGFSKPQQLTRIHDYLLSLGFAIVTTNLIDLKELDVKQDAMSENFHAKVQLSIDHLYHALKNPRSIIASDEADELALKKIFLNGASFGGMLVLRHAELFPDNFDGYISHDGGLIAGVGVKGDRGYIKGRGLAADEIKARAWLSPMTESEDDDDVKTDVDPKILQIKKPVLLLHNFDDNNVNVLVSIKWYQKVLANNKHDLVRLVITRKGNPLDASDPLGSKGHFVPTGRRDFLTYREALASFMLLGEHRLDELTLSKREAREFEIYAYHNYSSSTLDERFLSLGYRWYQNQQRTDSCRVTKHTSWEYLSADKISLSDIYFLLAHLDRLEKNPDELKNALTQLGNQLTDDEIDNAIRSHFPQAASFVAELYGHPRELFVDIYNNMDLNDTPPIPERIEKTRRGDIVHKAVDSKPGIRNQYRHLLIKQETAMDNDFRRYLLYQIYLANPERIKILSEKYSAMPEIVERMKAATMLLDKKIHEGQKLRCRK